MTASLALIADRAPPLRRRIERAGMTAERPDDPASEAGPGELLMRVVEHRDRAAFKALFLMLGPRVKTYLLRLGVSAAQADELTQETFLAVWRRANQYRPERGGAAAWIFTIARNLRIDAVRRERSAMGYALAVVEPEPHPSPESEHAVAERESRLREAVKSLPQDQIEVIQLSFFADKAHAEIARDLSLPLGTVKSRLRLAVQKLRAALGDLA